MFIKKKENASLRHENTEIKEQIESNKSKTDAKLQKIISHLEQKNNELQKENNEMKTLIKNSGDKNEQKLVNTIDNLTQENYQLKNEIQEIKYLIDNFGNENYIIIESKLPTKQINEINSDDIIFIKSAFAEKMLKTKIYSKTECIQQFTDSITKLANNITTRTIKNCAFCQCSSLTHIKIPKFCSLIEKCSIPSYTEIYW